MLCAIFDIVVVSAAIFLLTFICLLILLEVAFGYFSYCTWLQTFLLQFIEEFIILAYNLRGSFIPTGVPLSCANYLIIFDDYSSDCFLQACCPSSRPHKSKGSVNKSSDGSNQSIALMNMQHFLRFPSVFPAHKCL